MKLNIETLQEHDLWQKKKVIVPTYSMEAMKKETKEAPTWVHFGGGNLFRGFIAPLQQRLLETGKVKSGILLVETHDTELVEKIWKPHDNLSLNVTLERNGRETKEIIASVAEVLTMDDLTRLQEIFKSDSLAMVSFTITEGGYSLKDAKGNFYPSVEQDFKNGVNHPTHSMSLVTSLLLTRFHEGEKPLALVSMDNAPSNGDKLKDVVVEMATAWKSQGLVGQGFLDYLENPKKISFPWTMIDKITPYPVESVRKSLEDLDIEGMETIITEKGTHMAPFVNGERYHTLLVENSFPGIKPPLEEAGVKFGRRLLVRDGCNMKMSACFNPLQTAMAIFASLMGEETMADAMERDGIMNMVKVLGYLEGLPVVKDPKIIDPREYLDQVTGERLSNPVLIDVPHRILVNTSEKMAVRYGVTVKAHKRKGTVEDLVAIPLVIAGWFRYLMGVDDKGNPMECAPDPMLEDLQAALATVKFGDKTSYKGQLRPFLKNRHIFGVNYRSCGMMDQIEHLFVEMLRGEGAVEKTIFEAMIPMQSKIKKI